MKTKTTLSFILAASLFAGCASEHHASKAMLESQARISRADAEKTALTQVPNGTIKEGEIEKEHGKPIWSFDIAQPGSADIKEVAVDAINGQVVSVETEMPEQQAKEKAEDANKKEKD